MIPQIPEPEIIPNPSIVLPSGAQAVLPSVVSSAQLRPCQRLPVLWCGPKNFQFDYILEAWGSAFPDDPLLDFDSGSEVLHFLWNPIALKPRVVVVDTETPYPSGWDILQAIRANPSLRHLPVAVITHGPQVSCLKTPYTMGADWCFFGPETPEQARLFVQAAVRHFQKGRFKGAHRALAA